MKWLGLILCLSSVLAWAEDQALSPFEQGNQAFDEEGLQRLGTITRSSLRAAMFRHRFISISPLPRCTTVIWAGPFIICESHKP